MIAATEPYTIVFPDWYDERAEFETPHKGFLNDVLVRTADGFGYRLYFSDPVRLQQTLEDDAKRGRAYFTEPGLVVLTEVTTDAIRAAVAGLWHDGYFEQLKRCSTLAPQ
jgi:hypothetical protein